MVIRNKTIIAVGGGKGGVGKSFLAANLGTVLANKEKKVTLVDTNLSASNLHTLLGISVPERTLRDFLIDPHENLHSILMKNPFSDALLISGAADVLGLTAPSYNQKQRLFRGLKALNCDILILDLPTGSSAEIIDIFMLSNNGLIVMDPMSTSLESTFQFLKNVVFRILIRFFKKHGEVLGFLEEAFSPRSKLKISTTEELLEVLLKMNASLTQKAAAALEQFSPYCVLNGVRDQGDREVMRPFQNLVKKYLGVQLQCIGSISFDGDVETSVRARTPLAISHPHSQASLDIQGIAETFS